MAEYSRDYIGSADAYAIYRGNYEGLINSKLRDSNFMSDAMKLGKQMELDILEQVSFQNGKAPFDHQAYFEKKGLEFCRSHVDGLFHRRDIAEVKTSKYDSPESLEELKTKYPQYYYQVQWQLWCAGPGYQACIIWCKVPDPESGKSPYDTEFFDLTKIVVPEDRDAFDTFEINAREFWVRWTRAKELADVVIPEMAEILTTEYVQQEIALIESLKQLKAMEAGLKATRETIKNAMREAGVTKYSVDGVTLTYVGPSTRVGVDTDKLKADGLYDTYKKVSNVSDSVRIRLSGEEE